MTNNGVFLSPRQQSSPINSLVLAVNHTLVHSRRLLSIYPVFEHIPTRAHGCTLHTHTHPKKLYWEHILYTYTAQKCRLTIRHTCTQVLTHWNSKWQTSAKDSSRTTYPACILPHWHDLVRRDVQSKQTSQHFSHTTLPHPSSPLPSSSPSPSAITPSLHT